MATRYACTGASPSPLAICGLPPASNFTFEPFPFFPSLRASRAGVTSCLRALFELAFISTVARISVVSAFSSIGSPSWKSIARRVLPSRLALNSPAGSASAAPLAKVIFTTFLYVSPVQRIPLCDHTGTPLHFHSSTTSGTACLMILRIRASTPPRQSPSFDSLSSLIRPSISREGEGEGDCLGCLEPLLLLVRVVFDFFMVAAEGE